MEDQQRTVPHVCVTDGKQHIRNFLREALKELGFTAYECAEEHDLNAALDARTPDLVLLGLMSGSLAAGNALRTLSDRNFTGMILPVAQRDSTAVSEIQSLAERLGITILPPLLTPFTHERLRDSVAGLLPETSSKPLVDLSEAVRGGWLELWYQPKIDARSLVMRGAEALLRVRHPIWGIIPPAYFIAKDGDPRFHSISETVISRVIDDWHYFFLERGHTELAINLPITFFKNPASINSLRKKLPHHAAFEGLLVESNGTDIARNLTHAKDVARELRLHKIAISVDDVGAEWPSLTSLNEFPFVEIKIDRKFVLGCAGDQLKQSMCRRIIDLGQRNGARTVAEGVETWADFLTLREMGVDLVQGVLFAEPMSVERFARDGWSASQMSLPSGQSFSIEELADCSRRWPDVPLCSLMR
jgi:EAL domain-containing protein (putative c-di-GMP-specific phosphodiesterase class I)/CheY-like chemotaxis protein